MAILLGLHGKARSGKDTVGTYLEASLLYAKLYAFADPVKQAASVIFNVPLAVFYGEDRSTINEYWGISPREMMQLVGTEACRNSIRDDIWIRHANLQWEIYSTLHPNGVFVVTDVRFENEAEWIRDTDGVVWHIHKDDVKDQVHGIKGHQSEAGVKFHAGDMIIDNNGALNELWKTIDIKWEDIVKDKAWWKDGLG